MNNFLCANIGLNWCYNDDTLCSSREPELTPEERDVRTVFCMQLSARIRPRDLEEFFSSVGKVIVFMLLLLASQNYMINLKNMSNYILNI